MPADASLPSPVVAADASPGAAAPAGADAVPARFEDAVAELERLVGAMESGQMPLDELLASHRRGGALLAHCRERLQSVERQVRLLDGETLREWPAA